MSQKEYRKLQGSSSLIKRTRVWLAKDHVLSVENLGYSEDYRRFFFRDIQAIVIQPTSLGSILNLVLGFFLIAPLCGIVAGLIAANDRSFQEDDIILFVILCVIGLLILIPLVVNIARGKTCACYIRTAVQTERLAAINRVRVAQRFVETLKPLISEAQGTLAEGEIQNHLASVQIDRPAAAPYFAPVAPPPQPCKGKIHFALYTLLVVEALVGSIDFFYTHPARDAISMLFSLATFVVLIIALVNQHGTVLWGRIKVLTWVTLVFEILSFGVAFTVGIVLGIQHPERATEFRSMSPQENPTLFWLCIVTVSVALVLGTLGLMLVRRYRQELARPVSAPPPTVTIS